MNRFIFFILMSLLLIVYTIFDITQLYLFKNSLKETAIIVNSGSIDRIETGTTLQLVGRNNDQVQNFKNIQIHWNTKMVGDFTVKESPSYGHESGVRGIREIAQSPDGESIAYVVRSSGFSDRVIKNDSIIGDFYNVFNLVYSSDGGSFAFREGSYNKESIIRDGIRVSSQYPSAYNPMYSPIGTGFLFQAITTTGKMIIVKDRQEIGADYVYVRNPLYGPDNSFSYIAHVGTGDVVVHDGKIGQAYEQIFELVYAPKVNKIAYSASSDIHGYVIVDSNGIEHKVPYLPSHLQYSSDGNEIAYTYYDMVRSKLHVVKGESEYELPLDYVHNIKYLQDNLHLIILGSDDKGRYALYKDSLQLSTFGGDPPLGFLGVFSMSPVGQDFAYVSASGSIIIGGEPITGYDQSTYPIYSSDGHNLLFVAQKNQEALVVQFHK